MITKRFFALFTLPLLLISGIAQAQFSTDEQVARLNKFIIEHTKLNPTFVAEGKSSIFSLLLTITPNGSVSAMKFSDNTPQEFSEKFATLNKSDVKWNAFLKGRTPQKKYVLLLTFYVIVEADKIDFTPRSGETDLVSYFADIYRFNHEKIDFSSVVLISPVFINFSKKTLDERM